MFVHAIIFCVQNIATQRCCLLGAAPCGMVRCRKRQALQHAPQAALHGYVSQGSMTVGLAGSKTSEMSRRAGSQNARLNFSATGRAADQHAARRCKRSPVVCRSEDKQQMDCTAFRNDVVDKSTGTLDRVGLKSGKFHALANSVVDCACAPRGLNPVQSDVANPVKSGRQRAAGRDRAYREADLARSVVPTRCFWLPSPFSVSCRPTTWAPGQQPQHITFGVMCMVATCPVRLCLAAARCIRCSNQPRQS